MLELHGWGELGNELTRLFQSGPVVGKLIDDDVLNAFAIVAPPEEVAERLESRCAGVISRVSVITTVTPSLLPEILK